MSQPESIDPRSLRPGPIRHESLPPEVLDRAKAVHDILGPYLGTTLGSSRSTSCGHGPGQ